MQIRLNSYIFEEKIIGEKERHKDAKFIEELTFTQLKKICKSKAVVA